MKKLVSVLLIVSVLLSTTSCSKMPIENHDKYITYAEYEKLLINELGIQTEVSKDTKNSDKIVTGKYAAITALKSLGKERVKRIFNLKTTLNFSLKRVAIKYEIISRDELKNNITYERAQEILASIKNLLFDYSKQSTYSNIEYSQDVIKISSLKNAKYSDNVLITSNDDVLEKGAIVEVKDDFGFAELKSIDSVSKANDSSLKYELSDVEDISDIVKSYSSNQLLIFNYLLGLEPGNEIEISEDGTFSTPSNAMAISAKVATNHDVNDYKSQIDKADFEFYVAYSEKEKFNNENGYSWTDLDSTKWTTYFKVSYEDFNQCYKFSTDDSGKTKLSVITESEYHKNIIPTGNFDVEETVNDTKADTDIDEKNERETNIKLKLTLSNLQVLTCLDLNPKDPYAGILTKFDFGAELSAQMKYKGKMLIAKLPLASADSQNGVFLDIYVNINFDGTVTLSLEMDNINIGASISKEGISLPCNASKPSLDLDIKASVEVGPTVGLSLKLLKKDILSFENDILAVVEAETVNGKGKYKDSLPCIQLSGYFPKFDIEFSIKEDALLGKLIKKISNNKIKLKATFHWMDEDNALLKKDIHIEYENGTKIKILGKTEDVCTHQDKTKQESENQINNDNNIDKAYTVDKSNRTYDVDDEDTQTTNSPTVINLGTINGDKLIADKADDRYTYTTFTFVAPKTSYYRFTAKNCFYYIYDYEYKYIKTCNHFVAEKSIMPKYDEALASSATYLGNFMETTYPHLDADNYYIIIKPFDCGDYSLNIEQVDNYNPWS